MSLLDRFDSLCVSHGDHDAVVGEGSSCCFLEIQHASNLLAAQLVYRFGNPDIVLLDLSCAAAAELTAVVSCMRLGILFCPVDGTDSLRLKQIVQVLQRGRFSNESTTNTQPAFIPTIAAIVLAEDDTDPRLSSFFHVGIHFSILVNESGDMLEPMTVPSVLPKLVLVNREIVTTSDDLYILFTSGTTSTEPKAVVGSHKQTLRRLRWLVDEIHEDEPDVVIARHHSLLFIDGIHELLSVLVHELSAKLYCSDSLDDLVKNSTRITMLPSQLAQILPSFHALSTTKKRSPLQLVIVSGEPCPPTVVEQFQANQYFASTRLFNFYGQTETVGDVAYSCLSRDPAVAGTVPVGRPIPDAMLELDPSTNEVMVSGESFANGYFNTSQPLQKPFHTGDVGFYVGDCLYVRGRLGDVGNVNGILTSPTEVETRFRDAFPECMACAAIIHEGSPYLLVESTSVAGFTRQKMSELQIPWNLIPRCVFPVHSLPRTSSGKVRRVMVKSIVLEQLRLNANSDFEVEKAHAPLMEAIASILGLTPTKVEHMQDRSFIDMGGDSQLAVALWHKLRAVKILEVTSTTEPVDFLRSNSVKEIESLLEERPQPERKRRMAQQGFQPFTPFPLQKLCDHHLIVRFPGCVDSAPLIDDGFVYGACQSGAIQRVQANFEAGDAVQSITIEGGWRIQASLVCSVDGIVACCSHSSEDSGLVVCVTKQLDKIQWEMEVPSAIQATPIFSNNHLLVQSGVFLYVLNTSDGSLVHKRRLRGNSVCCPVLVGLGDPLVANTVVLYVFSSWDCGAEVVTLRDGSSTSFQIEGLDTPIRTQPLVLGVDRVIAADVLGFVHDINLTARTVSSTKITNVPFNGAPTKTPEGNIVLGCNDGVLRCLNKADISVVLWVVNIGEVVRSRLVFARQNEMLVLTTAGNVLSVSLDKKPPLARTILKLRGEIWSDPLLIEGHEGRPYSGRTIAFGARDSRLHFVRLGV